MPYSSEPLRFEVSDPAGTVAFGRRLADCVFPGSVVALLGPLGAGKTYLVRAVAERLGVTESGLVNSPTFVLIQEYMGRLPIYHLDAYRLRSAADFFDLGVQEYFEGEGVCLVEWADRVEAFLPAEYLRIEIEVAGETARRFTIEPKGTKYIRLVDFLRQTPPEQANIRLPQDPE
jgi:tRNA threonylcarbamoyladenosine biosynthesis protein TsaE